MESALATTEQIYKAMISTEDGMEQNSEPLIKQHM